MTDPNQPSQTLTMEQMGQIVANAIAQNSSTSNSPRPYYGGDSYGPTGKHMGPNLVDGSGTVPTGFRQTSDGRVDINTHIDDFLNKWNSDAAFRTQLVTLGLRTGMLAQTNNGPNDFYNMWLKLGGLSSDWADAGKKMTPMQVLAFLAGGTGDSGLKGTLGGGSGKQTQTSSGTSVAYNLSDAATAKYLTDHILEAALGRKPDASEYAQYKAALNAYEQANPQVSSHSSTTTYDSSGNATTTDSSRQKNAGATAEGRQQTIEDKVNATPEAQAYQTSSLFDQAMKYLGGH